MIHYNVEQTARMNRTARSAGAVGADPIVVRHVMQTLAFGERALDYGAGPTRRHADRIERDTAGTVDTYDIGVNTHNDCHVTTISPGYYDCAFASNVLNVQPSADHMTSVFVELKGAIHIAGIVVWNYPTTPRHAGVSTKEMLERAKGVFGYAQPHPSVDGLFLAMLA